MNLLRGYGTLSLIFIVCAVVKTENTALKTMSNVVDEVRQLCDDIEHLPETLCGKVIDTVKSRVDTLCEDGVKEVCNDVIVWPFSLLVTEGTCEEYLRDSVCLLGDDFLDFANEECVEEMNKLLLDSKCDGDGKQVDLCEDLPNTVDGFCNVIVDQVCAKLPPALSLFEDICQDFFSGIIC